MSDFSPFAAVLGGVLIGLGLSGMLLGGGQIAGISGIVGGVFRGRGRDAAWRICFVLGTIAGGLAFAALRPGVFDAVRARPLPLVALAGLLVGVGTSIGRGCTSGHGICGMSRLSNRSILATLTFMLTGALTAVLAGSLLGRP